MKKIFTFILIILFIFKTNGQFIAEDFTLTDVNGVEHNLYVVLDSGKTVVLNFFITTCGTCQVNNSILNNIWQNYAFNGDSLWLWGIEASGRDNNEIVDYMNVYNINYPCFSTLHDDVVIYAYDITYTPQYVVICPNKMAKKVSVNNIESAIVACKQTKIDNINENKYIAYDDNFLYLFGFDAVNAEIISIDGKIIKHFNNNIIPIFDLKKGIYLVKIITDKNYFSKTIIK